MFWGRTPEAWSAIGAWAYAILTALLIVAALLNYFILRTQVRVAKEAAANQLAEAKKLRVDAVRPHLFMDKVTLLPAGPDSPQRLVEMRLRNVGRGAGINVRVEAWITPVPPGTLPGRGALWEPFVAKADADYESRSKAPSATANVMGIGERTDEIVYLMSNNTSTVPEAASADAALVHVRIRCFDQYGGLHEFPVSSGPEKVGAHWRMAQLEDRPPVFH